MIKIYTARDITEAQILKGLLEANDINTFVNGYYLQGGIGEVAPVDFAGLSVENGDAKAALKIIQDYEKNQPQKEAVLKRSHNISFNTNLIFIPVLVITLFILSLLLVE
ncbi:DUF2007 domain-containing protein [Beggiatoa alba]|nr:DUF2007 domain-containing protein [Beggiatoa alba]